MTSADIKAAILDCLRRDTKGLDQFAIADRLGQAPFRVRAELKALKRDRLVREWVAPDRRLWVLTDRGYARAFERYCDRLEIA